MQPNSLFIYIYIKQNDMTSTEVKHLLILLVTINCIIGGGGVRYHLLQQVVQLVTTVQ